MRSVTTIIYANYMCCGVTTAKHNGSHKGRWTTLCLEKRPKFETAQLKIIRIDFDDIRHKNLKDSIIEFACFTFHVGVLFINFSSFKPDTENNANFDAKAYQANASTLTRCNCCLKHYV